jgi:alkylhydroperoxidase family enzyme
MDIYQPAVRIPPAARPPLATLVATLAGWVTHTEPHRIFTTLAHHRRLFRRWLPLGGLLLLRGDLPRRDTELLILRTASNCGCWYEWVQHADIARSHGLTGELVDEVRDWPASDVWSPRQRDLLAAADELHRDRVITDATWARLATELRDTELIELCFLVGHYEMLAMTLNSLGVEPEPAALRHLGGRDVTVADALRRGLVSARQESASPPLSRSAEADSAQRPADPGRS